MKKGLLLFGIVLALLIYIFGYNNDTKEWDWEWLATGEKLITLIKDEDLVNYIPANGQTIVEINGKISTDLEDKNILWVPLDRIPQHLRLAIIAVEDNRFYQHGPFDYRGIARAVWVNLNQGNYSEGGSTITQQLVKNMYLSSDKTFKRKGEEAVLAYVLEKKFTKENILEMYLNQIYFGPGTYGIGRASEKYFHKTVDKLTLAESAILAGIPKNPAKYSPINNYQEAKLRQKLVLDRMVEAGFITRVDADRAETEQIHKSKKTK